MQTTDINRSAEEETIEALGSTIAAWSLSTTRVLMAELFECLYDEGLSQEQDYNLHMEVLSFFLLNFERYVVSSGGDALLESLNQKTVDIAIRLVLDELKIPREEMEEKVHQAVDYYNKTASDYDCCQVLVESHPDYAGDHTVFGKLAVRVAGALNKPAIPEIIDIISAVAAEALAESDLKGKVFKAAQDNS